MLLRDKVVLVSGVGPGLGQAIALQCARAGAGVVLAARTESYVDDVAAQVKEIGREAVTVPADVTDEAGRQRLAAVAVEAFGRVDALVHNAFAMPPMRDLMKVDLEPIRASFETSVFAALRLTQLVMPSLVQAQGSVVMINSAVLRHSRRTFGAYKMAKASLLAMAQNLASEVGPRGVRVNSVAPSYMWSATLEAYFGYLGGKRGLTSQQVYDEIAETIDLRRLIEPEEVADVVVFLASDLARAVTGQCIDVNGGEFHR